MVAHGTPCLGPVTQAGCGALCPAYDRGLLRLLRARWSRRTPPRSASCWQAAGVAREDLLRAFRTFNAWAPAFRDASRDP